MENIIIIISYNKVNWIIIVVSILDINKKNLEKIEYLNIHNMFIILYIII